MRRKQWDGRPTRDGIRVRVEVSTTQPGVRGATTDSTWPRMFQVHGVVSMAGVLRKQLRRDQSPRSSAIFRVWSAGGMRDAILGAQAAGAGPHRG